MSIRTRLPNPAGRIRQIGILVFPFDGPNAAEAISAPSRYQMEVQVEDRLFGRFASRGDQVHPLRLQGHFDRSANIDHRGHQVSAKRRVNLP
jgi:hypothetical protein